jgi:hypothetical protein
VARWKHTAVSIAPFTATSLTVLSVSAAHFYRFFFFPILQTQISPSQVLFFGGNHTHDERLNDCWILDTITLQVGKLTRRPYPSLSCQRFDPDQTLTNSYIFILLYDFDDGRLLLTICV